ncbi:hypothetical protein GCM10022419_088620 [Nonomuraea rosea]|uniref:D-serine dehydratase-like domain-containing protein n=1 Tax=Nonomuraea rosea TaxID=638574 RepID=A0ABP6YV74_9ACTN
MATEETAAARVLTTVVARLEPGHHHELPVGTRAQLIPSHACSAVNLFDLAYGVENGQVTTELRVAARGAVR